MGNQRELNSRELELSFETLPEFSTTMEILPFSRLIGQERAEKSIDLGLAMSKKGYNIFITGHSGTGKTGYLIKKIEEYSKNLSTAPDWCYVYNFKDPLKPNAICLETGIAIDFKESIDNLVEELIKEVPVIFNEKNYETQKNEIISKYEKLILKDTEKLDNHAKDMNFIIKQTEEEGYMFIPVNEEGREMDSLAYNKLDEENKELLNESASKLRLLSMEVIKETHSLEKQMDEALQELDDKIALELISDKISLLKNRYGTTDKLINYLDDFKDDIIKYIEFFIVYNEDGENKNVEMNKAFLSRYQVNIIVDNGTLSGAPVIFEDSPEYSNLFGKIEYENKAGNISTDFTMIRPGSLHIANNGFIIVNAYQLLSNPSSWHSLKRCIKSEFITIENSKDSMELYPIVTLKPENIPLNAKLILIGDEYTYSMLSSGDPEFNKLFKIKAEFDDIIEVNSDNTLKMIGFITDYTVKNHLKHLSRDGVRELLKYSSRNSESTRYYSSSIGKLSQVLDISNLLASKKNDRIINSAHIIDAIDEIEQMHGLIRKKILDMYKNKKYITELSGSKTGQINGLSVLDYGDCEVGQQHRITVTTYAGKDGIIDIERETDLSGSLHSKGIMILSGFIGQLIGQDISLSFNASIVFEQLYSGIEGDSASAAELIALLSSLSGIPIKQSLAITGSVNQHGEIQPIGGVIHKIEGFYDICKLLGLNGNNGVIIPETNADELVLKMEILEAVDSGLFHIYTVKNVEDCIELLFDRNTLTSSDSSLLEETKKLIIDKLSYFNCILNKGVIR